MSNSGDGYGNQQLRGGETVQNTGSGVYAIFRTTDFASFFGDENTNDSSTEQEYDYQQFFNAGE
jgi:hypothetical protein